jgi:hypothetical protein
MTKRYTLDVPPHLTPRETEAVIEVLEDMLDLLSRHLYELDRRACPTRHNWEVPPWVEGGEDSDDPSA